MNAALEFNTVDFDYGQGSVLSAVSLAVTNGEVVALVGPSGAGKSTLLALADGTLTPKAGRVMTLGHPLAELSERARRIVRTDIGVVPQAVSLPGSLRVLHNVNTGRLGRWTVAQSIRSLISPIGRGDVLGALAQFGIEDLIDPRTDTLSGGQQQRVALARLVVQRPQLVLADEPVSAVDPAWSDEVLGQLKRMADGGVGVLVSVHDPDLARIHCSRVVGLRDGSVVFDRPVGEIDQPELDALYRIAASTIP